MAALALPTASRRAFLKVGALAGGGLALGFELAGDSATAQAGFAPNAFIRIDNAGLVTLVMPNQEMGQGIYTAHSQLLAEELDVAMGQVRVEAAPASDELYGGARKRQGTGGSSSIRGGFYTELRQAGANARALLVQAAAKGWGVDPATVRTAEGVAYHDATQRQIGYGALAGRAAGLQAPAENAPLKPDNQFKIIGKPVKRLDTPAKVNGSAQYGIDAFPGQTLVATPIQAPVVGGTVAAVDDAAARAVPGVRQIVVLDELVAVVGDNTWAAIKGANALRIQWNDGPHATIDSAQIWKELRDATSKPSAIKPPPPPPTPGTPPREPGKPTDADVTQAFRDGDLVEAAYELPFLSHSPMEPLNVTLEVKGGTAEVWAGSQVQARAQKAVADALGLDQKAVTFNNYMLGGAFGRRLDIDMFTNAARIAKQVPGKVKVMWTREEDLRHDMLRPVYRNVMQASLKDGRITALRHHVGGGSVGVRMSGKPLNGGYDGGAVDGAEEVDYAIPLHRVEFSQAEPRCVGVGYWRGVGPNSTIFALESFMDELAKKAGQDPVEFRLAHLAEVPRLTACLKLAAEKSGWSTALGSRAGRGICAQNVFGSYMATVCEVEVTDDGDVIPKRYVMAVDAGRIVNPDTVVAQIEGGLAFGLGAALWGDITIANGRIQQSNFNDYRMLRIHEMPKIEVHIIASTDKPGGIGEPGTTAAAPSLVNAIYAATGKRLRRLPIDREFLAGRREVEA